MDEQSGETEEEVIGEVVGESYRCPVYCTL